MFELLLTRRSVGGQPFDPTTEGTTANSAEKSAQTRLHPSLLPVVHSPLATCRSDVLTFPVVSIVDFSSTGESRRTVPRDSLGGMMARDLSTLGVLTGTRYIDLGIPTGTRFID